MVWRARAGRLLGSFIGASPVVLSVASWQPRRSAQQQRLSGAVPRSEPAKAHLGGGTLPGFSTGRRLEQPFQGLQITFDRPRISVRRRRIGPRLARHHEAEDKTVRASLRDAKRVVTRRAVRQRNVVFEHAVRVAGRHRHRDPPHRRVGLPLAVDAFDARGQPERPARQLVHAQGLLTGQDDGHLHADARDPTVQRCRFGWRGSSVALPSGQVCVPPCPAKERLGTRRWHEDHVPMGPWAHGTRHVAHGTWHVARGT